MCLYLICVCTGILFQRVFLHLKNLPLNNWMQVFAQCKPHFNHQLAVPWHGRSRSQGGARMMSLSPGAVGCSAAPVGLCQGEQDSAHKSWVAHWLSCSPPLALQAARSVRWASPTPCPDPADYPNTCFSCPCMRRVPRDLSSTPKPWQAGPALRDMWASPAAAPCVPAASGHHCHVWIQVISGTPVMWV